MAACTGVTGEEGSAIYLTKSITLQPGGLNVMSYSYTLDNLGILFGRRLSFSCNLPAGVGLNNNSVTTLLSSIRIPRGVALGCRMPSMNRLS